MSPKLFGSGPAAIEALLADEVDLTYVGPSPAINGFIRSEGKALRVIAGAVQGGAVFVRRSDVVLNQKGGFFRKALRVTSDRKYPGYFAADLPGPDGALDEREGRNS